MLQIINKSNKAPEGPFLFFFFYHGNVGGVKESFFVFFFLDILAVLRNSFCPLGEGYN